MSQPRVGRQEGERLAAIEFAIAGTLVVLLLTIGLLLGALAAGFAQRFGGVPMTIAVPIEVQVAGAATSLLGLSFGVWAAAVRTPRMIISSTYFTLRRLLGGKTRGTNLSRTEPFVWKGPYAYVRNPMYFGVVAMILGGAAMVGSTTLLAWGVVMAAWFRWVLVPFEEREMLELFGQDYARYSKRVPMLVPRPRRSTPLP